jgi:hypothetical protein
MPIHPSLGVAQVQPQPQVQPVVHVQLVVQPQPQEQALVGTAGWVMGVEQVQAMGFLRLVVDGGNGSAVSANQASTLQWSGESKGRRSAYRPMGWADQMGSYALRRICATPQMNGTPAQEDALISIVTLHCSQGWAKPELILHEDREQGWSIEYPRSHAKQPLILKRGR